MRQFVHDEGMEVQPTAQDILQHGLQAYSPSGTEHNGSVSTTQVMTEGWTQPNKKRLRFSLIQDLGRKILMRLVQGQLRLCAVLLVTTHRDASVHD